MLERLTPAQLARWMDYAEIEPFGQLEADFRAAILNSTIAAVAGAKGIDPMAFTLGRFIEKVNEQTEPPSDEAKLDGLFGIARRSSPDEKKLDGLLGLH